MKNRITILVKLDSSFQLEYFLDEGNRVGCVPFNKDALLLDILRYCRNLISPYNVDTNILYEVARDKWQGVYPGMCINPQECKGRTSCPRALSCCE